MFSHALTFNGGVSRMCFIVFAEFYGQTHLCSQVSLNVGSFVWVLIIFFSRTSCVPAIMFLLFSFFVCKLDIKDLF